MSVVTMVLLTAPIRHPRSADHRMVNMQDEVLTTPTVTHTTVGRRIDMARLRLSYRAIPNLPTHIEKKRRTRHTVAVLLLIAVRNVPVRLHHHMDVATVMIERMPRALVAIILRRDSMTMWQRLLGVNRTTKITASLRPMIIHQRILVVAPSGVLLLLSILDMNMTKEKWIEEVLPIRGALVDLPPVHQRPRVVTIHMTVDPLLVDHIFHTRMM